MTAGRKTRRLLTRAGLRLMLRADPELLGLFEAAREVVTKDSPSVALTGLARFIRRAGFTVTEATLREVLSGL